MTKVWIIAPTDSQPLDEFQRIWSYQRDNGIVAIGWDMGDSSLLCRQQLHDKFLKYANNYGWNSRERHQVANFWLDIRKGDYIIARRGRKHIVGIGKATCRARYERHRELQRSGEPGDSLTSLILVDWQCTQEYEFSETVFSILTVSRPRKRWPQIKKALIEVYGVSDKCLG